ncbi:Enamine deaminase RidA, house cleaning of reactive enamine intermediates, YjgF/YER057c/UK114 family [Sphingomonas guangdongensis]|uniref:Enamine deaminase RidA, house cleaning of reactive enamine intermediates, YjgF/YER057c/UK114 family n=1 Tax=Sphingomonas guangdongensis TaxID=1141890 RepID=A0A285QZV8_9SPHN|nr:Enamine deaminase RidA, house cleaning of reactive enamine intermediates, YjgF/YER057c/UK114 family [Sphingomonas guangdongensis]
MLTLGLSLPPSPAPRGAYRSVTVMNGLAYVSGQVSRTADGIITGPVDSRTPARTIRNAAEACVMRALAALEGEVGLDAIGQIVFVRGFVFARAGFADHSRILDAASELIVAILGSAGEHARSAVGVSGLPGDGLLELEVVAAVGTLN